MRLRSRLGCVAWGLLALGVLPARVARAHAPFEITSTARLHADRLELRVLVALSTATKMCLRPGEAARPITRATFEPQRPAFEACARALYAITAGGQPLAPRAVRVAATEEDDLDATIDYPAPVAGPLLFDAGYLRRLPDPTYGATLTVTSEQAFPQSSSQASSQSLPPAFPPAFPPVFLGQQLLRADASTLEVPWPGRSPGGTPAAAGRTASALQFLRLGVEHILTGYDHLLFLLGLLIVCTRFRGVLTIVSCFTLAHSVTLALAGTGVLTLPSRVVEPLIAASIVFVGVENVVRARQGAWPRGRWALTFAFGLIHGFGFAGALRDLGLGAGGAPIAVPLLSFNLGVELGQVAVASVVLPLVWRLRAVPAFARHGVTIVSVAISAAGLYWLIARLL